MFTYTDAAGRQAARDDNRRALDEACTLNAPCLVLVVGGLPGALAGKARAHATSPARATQVSDGIAALLDYARERRMPLAIEPLHPMYAADRACINTLEQALDVCDALDPPAAHGALGRRASTSTTCGGTRSCEQQIERAGRERLLAFHVCDWLTPTTDLLNDRGMMGDGVIDIAGIRGWVEAPGLRRLQRSRDLLARTGGSAGGEVLDTCIERHRQPSDRRSGGSACRVSSNSALARAPALLSPGSPKGSPEAPERTAARRRRVEWCAQSRGHSKTTPYLDLGERGQSPAPRSGPCSASNAADEPG